jgi:hypothetical protein
MVTDVIQARERQPPAPPSSSSSEEELTLDVITREKPPIKVVRDFMRYNVECINADEDEFSS